ncbi:hypothetical protein [Pacificispira sp.]|uniref:hypothetical protein n=1 Tax=Pacificispira sp. TaxID=2888761 RepID=UPI003BAC83FE
MMDQDFDEGPSVEDVANFESLVQRIELRCGAAKISCFRDDLTFGDYPFDLEIEIQENESSRTVTVSDPEDAETILNNNFEDIRFIEGLDAYYESSTGIVHANVVALDPFGSMLSSRLFRLSYQKIKGEKPKKGSSDLLSLDFNGKFSISLRKPSDFNKVLSPYSSPRSLSMTLSLHTTGSHHYIKETLQMISNSLFFQIEQECDLPLSLSRRNTSRRMDLNIIYGTKNDYPEISFPKIQYEADAINLYWYAISARKMPLMQYLAFYQSIEFFFPKFSRQEAKENIRNILRRPNFKIERDADIEKIFRVSTSSSSRVYGSELEQLKSTVKSCIDENDLVDFINSQEDLSQKLREKSTLSSQNVRADTRNPDLLDEVSRRIYEIRCRIVHAKSDENNKLPPLMPYSEEEKYLHYDIVLIKYISSSVISSSGETLNISNTTMLQ